MFCKCSGKKNCFIVGKKVTWMILLCWNISFDYLPIFVWGKIAWAIVTTSVYQGIKKSCLLRLLLFLLFFLLCTCLLLKKNFNQKWLPTEVALQRWSYKKMFWKYAANLQETTHAEVWYKMALRHGCSPVNLQHISEHCFLRTPLEGSFCR